MQTSEILNQEQLDQDLPFITKAFAKIYDSKEKQLSYEETYKAVYKLCKRGMSQNIIKELISISKTRFRQTFDQIEDKENLIESLTETLGQLNESTERIMEVLLYVESNYFHGIKRDYNSIKDLLNSILYQQLNDNSKILQRLSIQIANARIQQRSEDVSAILMKINELDEKETFFGNFLIPVYRSKLSEYYSTESKANYSELSLRDFLLKYQRALKSEREWLTKYFQRSKEKKLIDELMKQFYVAAVDKQKQKMYIQKSEELYHSNTLEMLELLNEKKEEKQLNDFNEWFMLQTQERLQSIDRTDNSKFINSFITLYEKVSETLASTKNFNIRYKAIFFFEHWINNQKIGLPKRLNIYIDDIITGKEKCLTYESNFKTIFKLLKEKDYFEKQFRREMVLRIIYQNYDATIEVKFIEMMKEECGTDWVSKIVQLRQATPQSAMVMEASSRGSFNAVVFDQISWPMDKNKLEGQIPMALLNLSGDYSASYQQKFKGRKMVWHPVHGKVELTIRFDNCKMDFKVSTVMASILIYLEMFKNRVLLQNLVKKSKYSLKDLQKPLKWLQKFGLIETSGDGDNFEITLKEQFKQQGGLADLTNTLAEKVLQAESQQELKADRKMMVEAMIVKIMKKLKTTTLIKVHEEIRPIIEQRGFLFNDQFVNITFKGLVNKNYIRDLENGTYSYIAS